MKKYLKKYLIFVLLSLLAAAFLTGCAKKSTYTLDNGSVITLKGKKVHCKIKREDGKMVSQNSENIKIKAQLENGGVFVMELYPEYAPETVQNFADLVDDGFYDGLTFHRIIPGFMAQGGDPNGDGTGGSGSNIRGEFKSNGFASNTLKHKKGTVSMARAMDPDSASSQFFICFEDAPHLDGDYAAFGKVVYGMDTVDTLADVATDMSDKPLVPVVIKQLSIITDDEYENLPR